MYEIAFYKSKAPIRFFLNLIYRSDDPTRQINGHLPYATVPVGHLPYGRNGYCFITENIDTNIISPIFPRRKDLNDWKRMMGIRLGDKYKFHLANFWAKESDWSKNLILGIE
jgi:hypothetical protein